MRDLKKYKRIRIKKNNYGLGSEFMVQGQVERHELWDVLFVYNNSKLAVKKARELITNYLLTMYY